MTNEMPVEVGVTSGVKMRRLSFVILHSCPLCGIILQSCNVAPKYNPPEVALPQHFKTSGPWREAKPGDHEARGTWWRLFGDSRLTALMQRAEANSPSLEVAMHKVDEARARARADRADLLPFVSSNSSAVRAHDSGTITNRFAGGSTPTRIRSTLDLEYELDFWGKLRNQSAASIAGADAAGANYRSALLTLQSELALNYFALRSQDAQIALLKRAIELRGKAVDLAKARFKQGDTAQLDVAQAETEFAEVESEAIGLEKSRARLDHAIADIAVRPSRSTGLARISHRRPLPQRGKEAEGAENGNKKTLRPLLLCLSAAKSGCVSFAKRV